MNKYISSELEQRKRSKNKTISDLSTVKRKGKQNSLAFKITIYSRARYFPSHVFPFTWGKTTVNGLTDVRCNSVEEEL